jgi:uncharacterized protein YidB (DUF937 family)
MSYLRVSITTWELDLREAEGQSIIQKSRDELIPLLRRLPGFVRYQGALTGPRSSVQVYEWESEAQAQTGTQQLTEWLQSSGSGQQIDSADVHLGEVIVSS